MQFANVLFHGTIPCDGKTLQQPYKVSAVCKLLNKDHKEEKTQEKKKKTARKKERGKPQKAKTGT